MSKRALLRVFFCINGRLGRFPPPLFCFRMPKRKRESQPKRKKKVAKKRSGAIQKRVKKELNAKQRACFIALRQCIKDFKDIEADAVILGSQEPSFLKSVGNGIIRASKGLLSIAADIASDPNVKLAAERALKAFLKSTASLPPIQIGTRPGLAQISIEELEERPEQLLIEG